MLIIFLVYVNKKDEPISAYDLHSYIKVGKKIFFSNVWFIDEKNIWDHQ